jgi:hypothetical protein
MSFLAEIAAKDGAEAERRAQAAQASRQREAEASASRLYTSENPVDWRIGSMKTQLISIVIP